MTTTLTRAPSVADYERMTQTARLAAARRLETLLRNIETRRLEHTAYTDHRGPLRPPPRRMHADEYTAEDTRRAAIILQRLYADRWHDTDQHRAARLAELKAALR